MSASKRQALDYGNAAPSLAIVTAEQLIDENQAFRKAMRDKFVDSRSTPISADDGGRFVSDAEMHEVVMASMDEKNPCQTIVNHIKKMGFPVPEKAQCLKFEEKFLEKNNWHDGRTPGGKIRSAGGYGGSFKVHKLKDGRQMYNYIGKEKEVIACAKYAKDELGLPSTQVLIHNGIFLQIDFADPLMKVDHNNEQEEEEEY